MGLFGWSYPPGCSGPPEEPEPHPKSLEAWEMLESAGVDEIIIEKICGIIEGLAIEAERDCPQCLNLMAAQEQEAQEEYDRQERESYDKGISKG